MNAPVPQILDLQFQGESRIIAAFLLVADDGLILVETGPHACFPALVEGLRRYGAAPTDIRHVLLTHIHLDHAGAAWALARLGAKIYVHPSGLPHLLRPERLMQSATRIYGKDMDRLWGAMEPVPAESLLPVAHGQQLDLGRVNAQAWHTPGHAPHHIAWQIGNSLFCGDVAGVRIDNGPVLPPCPPPSVDLEAWQDSISLLRKREADYLFLTHFGRFEASAAHWDELEANLERWAQWIQGMRRQGMHPRDMVPLFEQSVQQQIEGTDVDREISRRYALANPAWMSVYGLDRYWRVREGIEG